MEELIGMGILLVVVFVGGVAFDKYSCESQAGAMRKAYTWGPVQGCMVATKDGHVPIGQYRVNND